MSKRRRSGSTPTTPPLSEALRVAALPLLIFSTVLIGSLVGLFLSGLTLLFSL